MSPKKLTVFYYISSHGYGHAARASQVIAALPADARIIVRSEVDPAFITRESGRKVKFISGRFDTGVMQKDNRTLDWPATFAEAHKVQREAVAGMLDEVDLLRKHRADIVVCDVPPFPLEVARMAGLPSVVVGNFTWVDIFSREGKKQQEARELAEIWREQYALATLAVRTPPAFPMNYFPHITTVEPIARRGKNIRPELLRELGMPRNQKLVLLYFGTFGDDELVIPDEEGVTFVSMTPMPKPAVQIDPNRWHFPDVVASAHAVIAKPGYGTVGEAMANGTPLIYNPRTEFAEYAVLREAIAEWGGGVQMPLRNLTEGRWTAALNAAFSLRPKKVRCCGAKQTADAITELVY